MHLEMGSGESRGINRCERRVITKYTLPLANREEVNTHWKSFGAEYRNRMVKMMSATNNFRYEMFPSMDRFSLRRMSLLLSRGMYRMMSDWESGLGEWLSCF